MAAFSGIDFGDARKTGLYILPVESENPLPEVKKEWLKKVWAVLAAAECDGLFEDPIVLSAHDQYKTQRVSLDTLPIPVATADNTNGDNIARVMRARAALEAENERKDAYRARVIRDKKAALGQALLLAFEANAPMTAEELKSVHAHVLVAATAVAPAKYDGVLMLGAYVARAGLNDATRQDAEAESLFKELTVEMPHNLTATQLGVHFNKFKLKCVPFLLRPLSDEGQVKWILDLLPRTGATASSRVLIISKLRDMNATANRQRGGGAQAGLRGVRRRARPDAGDSRRGRLHYQQHQGAPGAEGVLHVLGCQDASLVHRHRLLRCRSCRARRGDSAGWHGGWSPLWQRQGQGRRLWQGQGRRLC